MSEFTEQKELIHWFRQTYPQYEKCTRLSLNGVNLGKNAGRLINQFKSQGAVMGEADLFFAIPSGEYHGLFIEMKDFGKKTTEIQDEYLKRMSELGYLSEICIGAEHAKKVIGGYLDE